MKLSAFDLKIIAALEYNAEVPLQTVASRLGVRLHVVHYATRKLSSLGILGDKRPIVDLTKLGYLYCTLFFSVAASKQHVVEKLVSFMVKRPEVGWLYELGGTFQFGASIAIQGLKGLKEFRELLASTFPGVIFDALFSIQLGFNEFTSAALHKNKHNQGKVSWEVADQRIALDDVELTILASIMSGNYKTYSELSRKTSIPLTTFERKRKHLEESKIITRYAYWVNPELLRKQVYLILLHEKGIDTAFTRDLAGFCQQIKHVNFITESLGDWQFEIGIRVATQQEVSQFVRCLYKQFPENIKSLQVLPVFKYLKVRGYSLGSVR